MTFLQIRQQITAGKLAPIYYLHGQEGYFIDKLVKLLETDGVVLQAGEAAFNRAILYGPETNARAIVNECRSFPVMANHRLVVVKEAHRLAKAEVDKLGGYLQQPVPSTVLVLAFKDRKGGFPKKAVDAMDKRAVNFHAKKLYDRDVQQFVESLLQESGMEVEPGIAQILVANLGLNLGLIENELEKMLIYLKATQQTKLTKAFVYEMINVDKEFNVFELIGALSEKQAFKAHMIIDRLTQNTKINPPTVVVSNLFRFYHYVALVHRHKLRDPNSVKHQFGVNYFQAKDYIAAASRYPLKQVYANLGYIEHTDRQLKGLVTSYMDDRHLLKTLVWRLLG